MFGLFKSKKQKAQEMMADISRGMIKGAIEEHGGLLRDKTDIDDFCKSASVSLGKIMLNKLKDSEKNADEDDLFTVGLFVMGATSYSTAVMNGQFEQTCTLALLEYYRDNGANDAGALSGDTINTYNSIMTNGKVGRALVTQVASFFENAGDEHLDKLMKLYEVMRSNLQ